MTNYVEQAATDSDLIHDKKKNSFYLHRETTEMEGESACVGGRSLENCRWHDRWQSNNCKIRVCFPPKRADYNTQDRRIEAGGCRLVYHSLCKRLT